MSNIYSGTKPIDNDNNKYKKINYDNIFPAIASYQCVKIVESSEETES